MTLFIYGFTLFSYIDAFLVASCLYIVNQVIFQTLPHFISANFFKLPIKYKISIQMRPTTIVASVQSFIQLDSNRVIIFNSIKESLHTQVVTEEL